MVNPGLPTFKNFSLRNVFMFHRLLFRAQILLEKSSTCGGFYFLQASFVWGPEVPCWISRDTLEMNSFGQSHQWWVDPHLACWRSWGENAFLLLSVGFHWSHILTRCLVKQPLPRHSSMELCGTYSHLTVKNISHKNFSSWPSLSAKMEPPHSLKALYLIAEKP